MPETNQKSFAEAVLRNAARGSAAEELERSFTAERQLTAQALSLHVESRDGRTSDGFAWAHYAGYRWKDMGSHERLVVMFGARGMEIDGHNLTVLVHKIREGQLNGIRELTGAQALSLQHANPDNQPIITSIRCYPDLDELMNEMKGGEERDESRHAGSARGR